jgi:hypothetical protein
MSKQYDLLRIFQHTLPLLVSASTVSTALSAYAICAGVLLAPFSVGYGIFMSVFAMCSRSSNNVRVQQPITISLPLIATGAAVSISFFATRPRFIITIQEMSVATHIPQITIPSQDIFERGNFFQMQWINARGHATQMVNMIRRLGRLYKQRICQAMGGNIKSLHFGDAISLSIGRPQPTVSDGINNNTRENISQQLTRDGKFAIIMSSHTENTSFVQSLARAVKVFDQLSQPTVILA